MRNLFWSNFEWFKKKTRVYLKDYHISCSAVKGKDEKIIFPIKKLGKHLTFSISKVRLDLHATDDNTNKHRPIFEIRKRKVAKIVKKSVRLGKVDTKIISFDNKELKQTILVDPTSTKFIQYVNYMHDCNILPQYLRKIQINKNESIHRKILLAYGLSGELKGILRCDHRRNGFQFASISSIKTVENMVLNKEHVKKRLLDEGLTISETELIWKRWIKFLNLINRIMLFIRRLSAKFSYFT